MIKVSRPSTIPQILMDKGAIENTKNCKAFDLDSTFFIRELSSAKVDRNIYGDKSVKNPLRTHQYQKCCFCESYQRDEDGTIEHFRPKSGYKSNRGVGLTRPGYYWLSYEFDNLYFACKH